MRRKIQPQFLYLALISLALICAGCTTPHMRLYDGPSQSGAETAVLKIQWKLFEPSARIQSIDGRPVEKGRAFALNLKEVELLPGAHTLEVSYFDGNIRSTNNATLTFTCKAGGIYELHVAPVDEGFGHALAVGAGGQGHWTAWIIDTDTVEVLAGDSRTAPLRWYEK